MRDVLSDEEVVRRVVAGETELFELLLRRHNQRLFRAVRSVVRHDGDAEEALQLAWVRGWSALASFEGRARFTTWMTRIALRTAAEVARAGRAAPAPEPPLEEPAPEAASPDGEAAARELRRLVERAIDALPETYRAVVVLREIEGLSTAEVAADLGLSESAVKVRLFRARERLREDLWARARAAGALERAWSFAGERCDRTVAAVFAAVRAAE